MHWRTTMELGEATRAIWANLWRSIKLNCCCESQTSDTTPDGDNRKHVKQLTDLEYYYLCEQNVKDTLNQPRPPSFWVILTQLNLSHWYWCKVTIVMSTEPSARPHTSIRRWQYFLRQCVILFSSSKRSRKKQKCCNDNTSENTEIVMEYMCENLGSSEGWTMNGNHDDDNIVNTGNEKHKLLTSIILCRVITDESQLVDLVTL